MQIFLDSTLLISDPFLKGKYTKRLFDLVIKMDGEILIADLVLKEARKNFIQQLDLSLRRLKNQYKEVNRFFLEDFDFKKKHSLQKYIETYDDFYKEFTNLDHVFILETDNGLLPEVIHRSINGIKPFSENKQEFKDCLIWLTYSNYVEECGLDNCFFISNNISDFYDESRRNLHLDLLKDTINLKPYRWPSELLKNEPFFIKNDRLISWLQSENITEGYVKDLLETKLFDELFDYVNYLFTEMNTMEIYHIGIGNHNDFGIDPEYIEPYQLENKEVFGLEIKLLDGELLLSGITNLFVDIEMYRHNPVREYGDTGTLHLGSERINLELSFSFIYNHKKEASDLTIHDQVINGSYILQPGY